MKQVPLVKLVAKVHAVTTVVMVLSEQTEAMVTKGLRVVKESQDRMDLL